ncbi:MAG TPA: hypothetical protein VF384_18585 [Planctomycetota bacterium]
MRATMVSTRRWRVSALAVLGVRLEHFRDCIRPRPMPNTITVAVPPRTAAIALSLATLLLGCSQKRPGRADLPQIVTEAAKADAASAKDGPPGRRAVRESVRHLLGAEARCTYEVWQRMQRPELHGYLLRPQSYIGGTFPSGAAGLLRQVQQLEDDYLAELRGFRDLLGKHVVDHGVPADQRQSLVDEMAAAVSDRWQPVVAAIEAHRRFVAAAAELYELVASQPESIRFMRTGLEFSDASLRARFDSCSAAVNDAHDAIEGVVTALDREQSTRFHWLTRTSRVKH